MMVSWKFDGIYPLVMTNMTMVQITMLLMGKSTINGSFSIAMFVYQRVIII